MVDLFIEKGFTYFDTAWMYCGFNSENVVKEALINRHPRETFTLATKMHAGFFNTKEEREQVFEQQRVKTGAEYFDYYLIHGISANSYEMHEELDSFGWLREKKEQGLVKHMGFSFHDSAELLDKILTAHPEMEFVRVPPLLIHNFVENAVKYGIKKDETLHSISGWRESMRRGR